MPHKLSGALQRIWHTRRNRPAVNNTRVRARGEREHGTVRDLGNDRYQPAGAPFRAFEHARTTAHLIPSQPSIAARSLTLAAILAGAVSGVAAAAWQQGVAAVAEHECTPRISDSHINAKHSCLRQGIQQSAYKRIPHEKYFASRRYAPSTALQQCLSNKRSTLCTCGPCTARARACAPAEAVSCVSTSRSAACACSALCSNKHSSA